MQLGKSLIPGKIFFYNIRTLTPGKSFFPKKPYFANGLLVNDYLISNKHSFLYHHLISLPY